ncbi:hypothetical protein EDD16DRAFT_509663 [Pisolithus croceorrhizus]|nr:hypothetical protein EDD16DRAFT_509663 [Pisolithus croceorrhizus]
MEVHNSSRASSSREWWQTWKWFVYTVACYVSHVILVIIHIVLLVLHKFRLEEKVIIPSIISNHVATVAVTVTLQTFGTGYGVLLVWLTQRLALRRDLLQRQTLTATHDKANAWGGLGAALNILLMQFNLTAAAGGVLLVMLYLGGITALHITSSSLMSLEPFKTLQPVDSIVQYEMLNLTDLPIDSDWATATALIRSMAGYPELKTSGLSGATLYETVSARSGYDSATVNAVTFGAQCYSLSNVDATLNPTQNGSYTVSATDGNQSPVTYSPIYGFYENVTYAVSAYGRTVTILATPPILDANLSLTIQIMTCVLSLTDRGASINASTNELLSLTSPSPPSPSSLWTPWQDDSTGNPDPRLDWFNDTWNLAARTTDFYGPTRCGQQGCLLSLVDEYLMALLGWQYNGTALNRSTTPAFPNTLAGLESSVAQVASGAAWAVLTASGYYNDSTNVVNVTQTQITSHLFINVAPVSIGLSISILLLALSPFLIHGPGATEQHAVESLGILQVIWLSSRHDAIQNEVAKAGSSSLELRVAGLRCTTSLGNESAEGDEVRATKGRNSSERES